MKMTALYYVNKYPTYVLFSKAIISAPNFWSLLSEMDGSPEVKRQGLLNNEYLSNYDLYYFIHKNKLKNKTPEEILILYKLNS